MKLQSGEARHGKARMHNRPLRYWAAGAAGMLLVIGAVAHWRPQTGHRSVTAGSQARCDLEDVDEMVSRYAGLSTFERRDMLNDLEKAGLRTDAVLRVLEKTQREENATNRIMGVDVARSLGYEQWRTWFEAALRSPDWRLRARAAVLLGSSGSIEDLELALRMFQNDPEGAVRVTALGAFGTAMLDYAIKPLMLTLLDEQEDTGVRMSAARVILLLGRFSGHAEEYLEQVIRSDEVYAAEGAAFILAGSGSVSALLRFLELLEEVEPSVTRCALTHGGPGLLFGDDIVEAFRNDAGELDYSKLHRWLVEDTSRVHWDEKQSQYRMR